MLPSSVAKFLLYLLFFVAPASVGILNAAPIDTLTFVYKKVDTVAKKVDTLKGKIDSATKTINAFGSSIKKDTSNTACCEVCIPNQNGTVDLPGWILVFLPPVFFLVLLVWLMKQKFNFKEAMSENTFPTIWVDNPQYTMGNLTNPELAKKENLEDVIPPTIEKTYLVQTVNDAVNPALNTFTPPSPVASISRYIAFISSILTLVVALGISSFYIYHYIRTGCPAELTGISTLLIALGIGVVPYAFNKVAAAVGKAKDV